MVRRWRRKRTADSVFRAALAPTAAVAPSAAVAPTAAVAPAATTARAAISALSFGKRYL